MAPIDSPVSLFTHSSLVEFRAGYIRLRFCADCQPFGAEKPFGALRLVSQMKREIRFSYLCGGLCLPTMVPAVGPSYVQRNSQEPMSPVQARKGGPDNEWREHPDIRSLGVDSSTCRKRNRKIIIINNVDSINRILI